VSILDVPQQRTDILETGPRRESEDDHRFYSHPLTGNPYLSVTYVIGACQSKPWLGAWAAKTAAAYAVDFRHNWLKTFRDGGDAGRDDAIKEITRTAAANRDVKANIGTYEHDVFEALLLDQPIPGIPDNLDGQIVEFDGELVVIDQTWLDQIADGFLNFIEDFGWKAIAAECTVASDEHEGAGTIDAIGRSESLGQTILLDVKTGAHLDAGILAQLGPYWKFPHLWLRSGQIVRKPRTDLAAILHLRPSYSRGYKLLVVTPEELTVGWDWWQAMRAQLAVSKDVPSKFGAVLYPPLPDGSQPPPMVEDLRSYAGCSRVVNPLLAAGIVHLADLADLDREDVAQIKGVGPKTLTALIDVMAVHGLTFRSESKVA
jgi:hypothetical protein